VDISSADPGSDAGEPKPLDVAKAADHTGSPDVSESAHSEPNANPDNKEVTKVLAYGPAEREAEAPEIKAHQGPESGEAPEIKADKTPPLGTDAEAAKSATGFGSALVPFVAKDQEGLGAKPAAKPRKPRSGAFQTYGMMAAGLAAFAGIAWAAAGSFYSPHAIKASVLQTASATPAATVPDGSETRRLTEEIRVLKKELDGLRSAIAQNPGPEELRSLKKSVDAVKNGLETTKSEVGSSIAQLSGKVERAQHDPAKLREISDRLDHMERATLLPTTTASTAASQQETATKPAQVPTPPVKAQAPVQPQIVAAKQSPAQASAAPAGEKTPAIANWVVRDVYDGIALVEGPHGAIEVIEGETIPGVGTVKSIERRGSGWIVVTSRGQLDSARD
jgi:hypothetical protein